MWRNVSIQSEKALSLTAWPSSLEDLEILLPHLWGALMTELPDFVVAASGVDPRGGFGSGGGGRRVPFGFGGHLP